MLKSEFEERVSMTVSQDEYDSIEQVYNNCDVDKDEFCRLWVKMNQNRVNKAKEEAKAKAAEEKLRDNLWRIVEKYRNANWETCCKFAEDAFSEKQQKVIESAGIPLKEERIDGWTGLTVTDRKNISTVIYEIMKYLKAA